MYTPRYFPPLIYESSQMWSSSIPLQTGFESSTAHGKCEFDFFWRDLWCPRLVPTAKLSTSNSQINVAVGQILILQSRLPLTSVKLYSNRKCEKSQIHKNIPVKMFKDKIFFDQNYGLEFLWIDQFAPPR